METALKVIVRAVALLVLILGAHCLDRSAVGTLVQVNTSVRFHLRHLLGEFALLPGDLHRLADDRGPQLGFGLAAASQADAAFDVIVVTGFWVNAEIDRLVPQSRHSTRR